MRRRGGSALAFIFGALAIFYGIQGLLAGAPIVQVAVQFILGGAMIGGQLYYMYRRKPMDVTDDDVAPRYIGLECVKNNHAFCTDPQCQCKCGHKGIH